MRSLWSILVASIVLVVGSAPSHAEQIDFPSRKAGYWEIRLDGSSGMPAMTVHACIDAVSDKAMMAAGLSMTKDMCPKLDMKRIADGLVIESECKIAGMTSKSKTVMSGDFQSSYTVKVTGTTDGMPAIVGTEGPQEMSMMQTAKWISDKCPDGVKPGDMQMPGGIKVNVNKFLEKK